MIPKDINPEYSLEGLMLKLKLKYLGYLMRTADSGKDPDARKDWVQEERLRGGRGWDLWMASPIEWTWVWASSGIWWKTGKSGMLQSMELQRAGDDWVTEQQQQSRLRTLSKPVFPVLHHLPELAQTHVHWVSDAISSSVAPFSSSSMASGYFLMGWLFASGGQSVGASASVLLMNIQDWFPLGLTGLISLQSKGLSRVFSNTTVQKHQFFHTKPSLWSNSHIHTWLLEKT